MSDYKRFSISKINPHLICILCSGYLIDATTIVECLHTFCKSCIVRYFESSKFCPVCDVQVHKTDPLLSIRPDSVLQKLVYKLTPNLHHGEMWRRKRFYSSNTKLRPVSLEDAGCDISRKYILPEDVVCLALKPITDNVKCNEEVHTRYFKCPANLMISQLVRLIKGKFELPREHPVSIYADYNEPLSDSVTLVDVACMKSLLRKQLMVLYYKICFSKKIKFDPAIALRPGISERKKQLSKNAINKPESTSTLVDTTPKKQLPKIAPMPAKKPSDVKRLSQQCNKGFSVNSSNSDVPVAYNTVLPLNANPADIITLNPYGIPQQDALAYNFGLSLLPICPQTVLPPSSLMNSFTLPGAVLPMGISLGTNLICPSLSNPVINQNITNIDLSSVPVQVKKFVLPPSCIQTNVVNSVDSSPISSVFKSENGIVSHAIKEDPSKSPDREVQLTISETGVVSFKSDGSSSEALIKPLEREACELLSQIETTNLIDSEDSKESDLPEGSAKLSEIKQEISLIIDNLMENGESTVVTTPCQVFKEVPILAQDASAVADLEVVRASSVPENTKPLHETLLHDGDTGDRERERKVEPTFENICNKKNTIQPVTSSPTKIKTVTSEVQSKLNTKGQAKKSQAIGYKTLKCSPRGWNPVIPKEQILKNSTKDRTTNKFFKSRNVSLHNILPPKAVSSDSNAIVETSHLTVNIDKDFTANNKTPLKYSLISPLVTCQPTVNEITKPSLIEKSGRNNYKSEVNNSKLKSSSRKDNTCKLGEDLSAANNNNTVKTCCSEDMYNANKSANKKQADSQRKYDIPILNYVSKDIKVSPTKVHERRKEKTKPYEENKRKSCVPKKTRRVTSQASASSENDSPEKIKTPTRSNPNSVEACLPSASTTSVDAYKDIRTLQALSSLFPASSLKEAYQSCLPLSLTNGFEKFGFAKGFPPTDLTSSNPYMSGLCGNLLQNFLLQANSLSAQDAMSLLASQDSLASNLLGMNFSNSSAPFLRNSYIGLANPSSQTVNNDNSLVSSWLRSRENRHSLLSSAATTTMPSAKTSAANDSSVASFSSDVKSKNTACGAKEKHDSHRPYKTFQKDNTVNATANYAHTSKISPTLCSEVNTPNISPTLASPSKLSTVSHTLGSKIETCNLSSKFDSQNSYISPTIAAKIKVSSKVSPTYSTQMKSCIKMSSTFDSQLKTSNASSTLDPQRKGSALETTIKTSKQSPTPGAQIMRCSKVSPIFGSQRKSHVSPTVDAQNKSSSKISVEVDTQMKSCKVPPTLGTQMISRPKLVKVTSSDYCSRDFPAQAPSFISSETIIDDSANNVNKGESLELAKNSVKIRTPVLDALITKVGRNVVDPQCHMPQPAVDEQSENVIDANSPASIAEVRDAEELTICQISTNASAGNDLNVQDSSDLKMENYSHSTISNNSKVNMKNPSDSSVTDSAQLNGGNSNEKDISESCMKIDKDSNMKISSDLSMKVPSESIIEASSETFLNDSSEAIVNDYSEAIVNNSSESILNYSSDSLVKESLESLVKESLESVVKNSFESIVKDSSNSIGKNSSESVIPCSSESILKDFSESILKDSSDTIVKDSLESLVINSCESVGKKTTELNENNLNSNQGTVGEDSKETQHEISDFVDIHEKDSLKVTEIVKGVDICLETNSTAESCNLEIHSDKINSISHLNIEAKNTCTDSNKTKCLTLITTNNEAKNILELSSEMKSLGSHCKLSDNANVISDLLTPAATSLCPPITTAECSANSDLSEAQLKSLEMGERASEFKSSTGMPICSTPKKSTDLHLEGSSAVASTSDLDDSVAGTESSKAIEKETTEESFSSSETSLRLVVDEGIFSGAEPSLSVLDSNKNSDIQSSINATIEPSLANMGTQLNTSLHVPPNLFFDTTPSLIGPSSEGEFGNSAVKNKQDALPISKATAEKSTTLNSKSTSQTDPILLLNDHYSKKINDTATESFFRNNVANISYNERTDIQKQAAFHNQKPANKAQEVKSPAKNQSMSSFSSTDDFLQQLQSMAFPQSCTNTSQRASTSQQNNWTNNNAMYDYHCQKSSYAADPQTVCNEQYGFRSSTAPSKSSSPRAQFSYNTYEQDKGSCSEAKKTNMENYPAMHAATNHKPNYSLNPFSNCGYNSNFFGNSTTQSSNLSSFISGAGYNFFGGQQSYFPFNQGSTNNYIAGAYGNNAGGSNYQNSMNQYAFSNSNVNSNFSNNFGGSFSNLHFPYYNYNSYSHLYQGDGLISHPASSLMPPFPVTSRGTLSPRNTSTPQPFNDLSFQPGLFPVMPFVPGLQGSSGNNPSALGSSQVGSTHSLKYSPKSSTAAKSTQKSAAKSRKGSNSSKSSLAKAKNAEQKSASLENFASPAAMNCMPYTNDLNATREAAKTNRTQHYVSSTTHLKPNDGSLDKNNQKSQYHLGHRNSSSQSMPYAHNGNNLFDPSTGNASKANKQQAFPTDFASSSGMYNAHINPNCNFH